MGGFLTGGFAVIRSLARVVAVLGVLLAAPTAGSGADDVPGEVWSMAGTFTVETVARGLDHPWSVAFLPGGDMLVTEKYPGRVRRVSPDGGVSPPLRGVPAVVADENGGLLGLALDPDFAANQLVYLAYSEAGKDGATGLAVARGRLGEGRLEAVEVVFRQRPKVQGGQNYGGRIAFGPDGMLHVFAGNRFADALVQDTGNTLGAIARVRPDGSVPPDNPFAGVEGADPALWSLGHRNPGAAAWDPRSGRLFVAEFGPWGGDELNRPFAGSNHGWPEVSWGVHYDGREIPDPPTRPEFEREVFFWSPTIGPSGAVFYSGRLVPAWRHSLLIGGLTSRSLVRLTVEDGRVMSEERLAMGARIRDVAEAPDGAIVLLTDEADGRILRLAPKPRVE